MTVYKVAKPFVSYGMYHEVGEVITDASLIDNLYVKINDCTLIVIDTTKKDNKLSEVKSTEPAVKAEPKVVKPTAAKVTGSKSVASKAAHTTTVKSVKK